MHDFISRVSFLLSIIVRYQLIYTTICPISSVKHYHIRNTPPQPRHPIFIFPHPFLILIEFPAVPYLLHLFEARRNFISYYGIFCAIICPGIEGSILLIFNVPHAMLGGNPVTSERSPQACSQTLMIQVKKRNSPFDFKLGRQRGRERDRRPPSGKDGNSAISYASALAFRMVDDFAKC